MASEKLVIELWEIIQKNSQDDISYNDFENDLNKAFNLPKDEVDRAIAIMISQAEVNTSIIGEYKGGSFMISQAFVKTVTSTIKYENQFIPGKQEYIVKEKNNIKQEDVGAILLTTELLDKLIDNYENLSEKERDALIKNFSKLSYNKRIQLIQNISDCLDKYSENLDKNDQEVAQNIKRKLSAVEDVENAIEEDGIEAVLNYEGENSTNPDVVKITQIEMIIEEDKFGTGVYPEIDVDKNIGNLKDIRVTCIDGEEVYTSSLEELGLDNIKGAKLKKIGGKLQVIVQSDSDIRNNDIRIYVTSNDAEEITGENITINSFEEHVNINKNQIVDESAKKTTLIMIKSEIKKAKQTGKTDMLRSVLSKNKETVLSVLKYDDVELNEDAIISDLLSEKVVIEIEEDSQMYRKVAEELSEEKRRDTKSKDEPVILPNIASFGLTPPISHEISTQEPGLSKNELFKKEMLLLRDRLKLKVGDEKTAQYLEKYVETLKATKEMLDEFELKDIVETSKYVEDSLKKEDIPDEAIDIFSTTEFSKELHILLTQESEMFFETFGKCLGKNDMYKIPETVLDRIMQEQAQEVVIGNFEKSLFKSSNVGMSSNVHKQTISSESDSNYDYLESSTDYLKSGFGIKNVGNTISIATSRMIEEVTKEMNSLVRKDKDKYNEQSNDDIPVQE